MTLRYIILIMILIIHLSGASVGAKYLPTLLENRLATGTDRDLPGATKIHCGQYNSVKGAVKKKRKTPSQVLTSSKFGRYAFTATVLASPKSPKPGLTTQFKYAQIKGGKNPFYALEIHGKGESAYWLPQGGSIDIPHKPQRKHYVFTADFSGCSWTVTPKKNGDLRLRHVEGGKEDVQFNNLSIADKGGNTTYAMQYKNYGYVNHKGKVIESHTAFAYMHFSDGRWTLYFQHKTCAPHPGIINFNKKKLLSSMTKVESKSDYPNVSGTVTYEIPKYI